MEKIPKGQLLADISIDDLIGLIMVILICGLGFIGVTECVHLDFIFFKVIGIKSYPSKELSYVFLIAPGPLFLIIRRYWNTKS